MSTRTDMFHGRQGGHWLPDDADAPIDPARCPRCSECGEPMTVGQWGAHYLCQPNSIVGTRCTCPPGCTDTHVGDTGRCDPRCEPCRIHRGTEHATVKRWKPKAPKSATPEPELEPDTQLSIFEETPT